MRALRYYGRLDARLEDVPVPTAGPGEVLIRVAFNGLCGSDVHEYFEGPIAATVGPHPLTGCSLPCILGHELSGTVEAVGPGVDESIIGSLVAVEPIETCGRCAKCRDGRRHLCAQVAYHGYNRAGGGLAELTVVRRDMVHVLRPGVSAAKGALVEPMAVARRAVTRARVRPGALVAVHGAGPIGMGALFALRGAGCQVVVLDPSASRRAAAQQLGAAVVLDPSATDAVAAIADLTNGFGADASIDAAGARNAFRTAFRSTRPDGTIVVVAHHSAPIEVTSKWLIYNEVFITGSSTYAQGDFAAVISAMGAGQYETEGWVTTIGFDGVIEDGLHRLQRQDANKILVAVGGEPSR